MVGEEAAGSPASKVRTAWPATDVVALELMGRCGVRVAELCGLRLRDVDRPIVPCCGSCRTRNGTGPETCPLPSSTLAALDAYLPERAALLGELGADAAGVEGVWLVRRAGKFAGRAWNQQYVDRLVCRCAARAGVVLPEDAAAHSLRHFFGSEPGLRGVPLSTIQQLLGHQDPRTTSVYTRAGRNDSWRQHRAAELVVVAIFDMA